MSLTMQPIDGAGFAAKFTNVELKGKGEFGIVYQATSNNKLYALKFIPRTKESIAQTEACIGHALRTKSGVPSMFLSTLELYSFTVIPSALDAKFTVADFPDGFKTDSKKAFSSSKKDGGGYILVQEFGTGKTGDAWLVSQSEKLEPSVIQSIIFQLTLALSYAKSSIGFQHNDLKLENIMITTIDAENTTFNLSKEGDVYMLENNTVLVQIIDFGLSSLRTGTKMPAPSDNSITYDYEAFAGNVVTASDGQTHEFLPFEFMLFRQDPDNKNAHTAYLDRHSDADMTALFKIALNLICHNRFILVPETPGRVYGVNPAETWKYQAGKDFSSYTNIDDTIFENTSYSDIVDMINIKARDTSTVKVIDVGRASFSLEENKPFRADVPQLHMITVNYLLLTELDIFPKQPVTEADFAGYIRILENRVDVATKLTNMQSNIFKAAVNGLAIPFFSKDNLKECIIKTFASTDTTIGREPGELALHFIQLLGSPLPKTRTYFGVDEFQYGLANALYHPFLAYDKWRTTLPVAATTTPIEITVELMSPLEYQDDAAKNAMVTYIQDATQSVKTLAPPDYAAETERKRLEEEAEEKKKALATKAAAEKAAQEKKDAEQQAAADAKNNAETERKAQEAVEQEKKKREREEAAKKLKDAEEKAEKEKKATEESRREAEEETKNQAAAASSGSTGSTDSFNATLPPIAPSPAKTAPAAVSVSPAPIVTVPAAVPSAQISPASASPKATTVTSYFIQNKKVIAAKKAAKTLTAYATAQNSTYAVQMMNELLTVSDLDYRVAMIDEMTDKVALEFIIKSLNPPYFVRAVKNSAQYQNTWSQVQLRAWVENGGNWDETGAGTKFMDKQYDEWVTTVNGSFEKEGIAPAAPAKQPGPPGKPTVAPSASPTAVVDSTTPAAPATPAQPPSPRGKPTVAPAAAPPFSVPSVSDDKLELQTQTYIKAIYDNLLVKGTDKKFKKTITATNATGISDALHEWAYLYVSSYPIDTIAAANTFADTNQLAVFSSATYQRNAKNLKIPFNGVLYSTNPKKGAKAVTKFGTAAKFEETQRFSYSFDLKAGENLVIVPVFYANIMEHLFFMTATIRLLKDAKWSGFETITGEALLYQDIGLKIAENVVILEKDKRAIVADETIDIFKLILYTNADMMEQED